MRCHDVVTGRQWIDVHVNLCMNRIECLLNILPFAAESVSQDDTEIEKQINTVKEQYDALNEY